jgi:hypothetical protein
VAPEQAVQFLRARAERLRGIAGTARTAISDPLRRLADEMEARADALEREHAPSAVLVKKSGGDSLDGRCGWRVVVGGEAPMGCGLIGAQSVPCSVG